MNIYEIESQILDCIDEETGEILDVERLEQLIQDKQDKIESVACWYKNVVAESEAIKAEISTLRDRKAHDDKLAESLKKYLFNTLCGEKFKTSKVSISYRKSSTVEVDDVYKVPDEYLTYKEPEPDKMALKAAMKAGKKFDSVRLVDKTNILIK